MQKLILMTVSCLLSGLFIPDVSAQIQEDTGKYINISVKGFSDYKGNIVELINAHPDYSTLSMLIQSSGLKNTLQKPGFYTFFAPTNEAFSKLPPEKLDSLLADQEQSAAFVTYCLVAGKYGRVDLTRALSAGNGEITLQSVNGTVLQLTVDRNKNLVITDKQGNSAMVTAFDQKCNNGLINGINHILSPLPN